MTVSNDRKIDLETAVSQILQSSQKKKPFFFIIGSGVSYPSIKSAGDIIKECKTLALSQNRLVNAN